MDLGLFQKDVASRIGVATDTIVLWESNTTTPQIRHIPKIVDFLGYNPLPSHETLAESLLAMRKTHGWSRRQAAKFVGLDESTLARLERGTSRRPFQETLRKLETFFKKRDY